MPEITRAQAAAQHIADTAERLSQAFARELARVLRDADRALRPILRDALEGSRSDQMRAVRGIALRRELRAALARAGYDPLIQSSTTAAITEMAKAVLSSAVGRAGGRFVQPSVTKLAALAEIGQSNLLQVGDDVAAALWRSLAQWLFTTRPVTDILDDLARVFEDEIPQIETLFDTQVSMFGRQVEALATADAGADQPFLYVGPMDRKTRPFCREHVGKVYTRAAIDALDNGQLPNPFITGGGFNCRHSFIAVESAELRAIANTGTRAPEFEQRRAA